MPTAAQISEIVALSDERDVRFYDERKFYDPAHTATEAMARYQENANRDPEPIRAALKLAAPYLSPFDAEQTILRLRKLPRVIS